jgi:hypothetical protein
LREVESPNVRFDERWHQRVDRTLFGHVDDSSGVWVDGLLQSLADSRKTERYAIRVGLPILVVIAIAAIVTALHQPPQVAKAIGAFFAGLVH